jgi:hypothetical protein
MRDKRARQARTWFYPLFVLALGGTAILTAGCGGSGGGSSSRSAFQVTANFAPYTGRDVQGYVGSLKITAQTGTDTPLGPFILKRGDAPLTISGLKSGKTYRISVEGLQGTNGTGSKVSTATLDRTAASGTTNVAIDTTNSEIASVAVAPGDVTLTGGQSQSYTFEAKNASGATILTSAQDTSFSASVSPNVGTFDAATNTYTAPAVITSGTTTARLDVTIGGKTASGTINFDDQTSRAVVALRWNADGRGLPGYAKSAKLALVDGGLIVPGTEKVVTRDQSGSYSSDVNWDKVHDGSYQLSVEAYASDDATGTSLASADFPITVSPDEPTTVVDMSTSSFKATQIKVYVQHGSTAPVDATNGAVLNEGETVTVSAKATDANGVVYLMGNELKFTAAGNNVTLQGDQLTGNVRGTGAVLTVNSGDTPPGSVNIPVNVEFGNPGIGVNWDAPTRDGAPGYAKSGQAEIFDSNGTPIPGFDPICFNRPASGRSNIFWTSRLQPNTPFTIRVTLYPELNCTGNALMFAEADGTTNANGIASQASFDFPTVGDASNVEVWVTRADGSVERYSDVVPTPVGRRAGPLFLSFGEQVTISTRVTDSAGTTTFFSGVDAAFDANVDYDATTGKATASKLGVGNLDATAQAGRGPAINLQTRVMPPAVVAFTDYDTEAYGGGGAVRTYLYVPGARSNSPRGDKIWEVPYNDNVYIGLALAEPGVVLPSGFCTGVDVMQPTVNSRGDKIAFVVAPFDTISGNVTLYKDVAVMDISWDANGAPIFGSILPQNVTYDTADQINPMFGPQTDAAAEGNLYYSSIEFDRNTGNYLGGTERDIFVRTDIFAASTPGTNLTSGITGNMFWPAIAPDNGDMAVVRKLSTGDITVDAQPVGTGKIVTIDLSPFAPSGEQIDFTADASSRISYVASKGIAPAGGGPLINDDKYYIAFARSFDGGVTDQVELLRDERTQAALGAFITQQLNANNPFTAAVDGAASHQFKVTDPRRVMAFLYNNTELRVKNITSPASGGIGTTIYTLDPGFANTSTPGGPVWPAPFDAFDPLAR